MSRTIGEFVCELCGDAFATNVERRDHIFAVHEIEAEDA
jgi:hypothetical protein